MTGSLPPLTYLAFDALDEGIGASQILAYVERLAARDVAVELHTFEKRTPDEALRSRLGAAGVRWHAHEFGRYGAAGGVQRVLAGARAVRGKPLVHARSDLSAASVLLGRPERWVWDVRSLFADQRLELGTLRPGSPEHRVLRWVEGRAAHGCDAAITLTDAVLPVLDHRHGTDLRAKATVVTTCVDTTRFAPRPTPPGPPRLLLAGTVNRYYDVPAMVALVQELRRRGAVRFVLASPAATAWEAELDVLEPERLTARPDEMPGVVADAHAGLSVCRDDAGISLTGSMPTKIGEFLASGRPVVVNPGLGDAGRLLPERGCGVALAGDAPAAVAVAADELEQLLADPATAERCRALALEHFDLDRGVDALVEVYRRAAGA